MTLPAIIGIVLVPFGLFWWAWRRVGPNDTETREHPDLWAADHRDPTDHHGSD